MEGSRDTGSARFWSFLHGSTFHFSLGQVALLLMGAIALGAALRSVGTVGEVGGEGVAVMIGMIIVVGVILRRAYVKQTVD